MIKKILHSFMIIAALTCVVLFAGCLKFESSFELLTSNAPESSETTSGSVQNTENSETEPVGDESISESSTAQEETESSTNAEESTSEVPVVSASSEYNILRTGEFSFAGTIDSSGEAMDVDIAIGKDKIYFTSDIDGLAIGLYVDGKKTYIYAPEHKKYLKMNSVVARMLQMDPDMFVELTEQLGFDKLPELSAANGVETGSLSGVPCEVYTFNRTDSTVMRIYMNGEKMLKLEYINASGKVSNQILFKKVTAGFPKMPPDGFEEMGYIDFFMLIAEGL